MKPSKNVLRPLTLASSSSARKALLQRLNLNFQCLSPDIDESAKPQESPIDLCQRLAQEKTKAVAARGVSGLIIGSDQVAILGDQILHKPLSPEKTIQQLLQCSGHEVKFYTSICVYNTFNQQLHCDWTLNTVQFRPLEEAQIRRYVELEQPYYCAGGFKVEGLGIALFESVRGDDPNALIGLPVIKLLSLLEKEGWRLF